MKDRKAFSEGASKLPHRVEGFQVHVPKETVQLLCRHNQIFCRYIGREFEKVCANCGEVLDFLDIE